METINIIIMVWMEYNEMNKYLCKSTTEFRKYNKMNTNGGDVDGDDDDGADDAQDSNDLRSGEDDARMRVPPLDPFRR